LGWGAHKARRLMRLGGVVPLGVKRSKYAGSGSTVPPDSPLVRQARQNLLKVRGLTARYFGHIWAEDFTYLLFQSRMYYLATIIDLYSRKIVGWSLSDRHDTGLIVAALLDALGRYQPPDMLHQDQGSEYCSERYDAIMLSEGIEASFSEKGHPWENGFQESFYRYFKIEIKAKELDRFAGLGALHEAIAKQLQYYNNERIHSALGVSPQGFLDKNGQTEIQADQTIRPMFKQQKLTNYLQQIVTGVRDRVFGKVRA
jgi:putative transposase